MNQKNSNIRKYKSISTGSDCTASQYIAELVCMRHAEKENKGSLEYKFWNNSKNEYYTTQVRVASKLIKKYGEEAVLHYLKSPGGKNVYSLGVLHSSKKFVLTLKFVEQGIKKSKTIVDKEKAKPKKVIEVQKDLEYKPRKSKAPNSLMSKLRKLDGKEKNK